uniref:Uncharacterized protein n=2 Tax=Moniliophthora roreri TaxID=221103 RepID=A0A0W0EVS9_MONRR
MPSAAQLDFGHDLLLSSLPQSSPQQERTLPSTSTGTSANEEASTGASGRAAKLTNPAALAMLNQALATMPDYSQFGVGVGNRLSLNAKNKALVIELSKCEASIWQFAVSMAMLQKLNFLQPSENTYTMSDNFMRYCNDAGLEPTEPLK